MRTNDTTQQWYAVTTKYKCEKLVTTALHHKGLEAYVPLLKRTRRYTRKIKNYEIPLINCYAFVRIALKDRVKVLEEPHVHQFIGFDGKIVPIPEAEMQMMRRVVGELSEVVVEPREWLDGDRVEVIAGNLTGIKGKLIEQSGKHEFVVELESLGYQLRMVVDRSMLRKVSKLESLTTG
jgi:transcription antitermination factor NusG